MISTGKRDAISSAALVFPEPVGPQIIGIVVASATTELSVQIGTTHLDEGRATVRTGIPILAFQQTVDQPDGLLVGQAITSHDG